MLSVQSEKLQPRQANHKVLKISQHFSLEGGDTLRGLTIAYTTTGKLNADRSNVVWIFHALTGDADPQLWWPEVVGAGRAIDTDKYFIVCANAIGSCYGSTGPGEENPMTGQRYGMNFPTVTVKDMVEAHKLLHKHLMLDKIKIGIGGSLGGQQLLEWAATEPDLFEMIIPIATNAHHSAWGVAFNAAQRMAMEADISLSQNSKHAGEEGLKAARAIAMLSYRSQTIFRKTQSDFDDKLYDFKADSYVRHQGDKLAQRFNAHSYYRLTQAMDSHNIGRNRRSVRFALKAIRSKAVVVGIKNDMLFPIAEQRFLARNIPDALLEVVESPYGHDAFLLETNQLTKILKKHIT